MNREIVAAKLPFTNKPLNLLLPETKTMSHFETREERMSSCFRSIVNAAAQRWGFTNWGQLGNGGAASSIPVLVIGLKEILKCRPHLVSLSVRE